ncbi:hypothetical protein KIW84_022948 [Lathyrus oleraceus]|uniref:Uncharacterized protein n=1 Tax=Pisum sativum TaxID=3888 RepID=A0A9D5B5V1_PEA|nr:hypothetical protein KIW84_022948 [Pisum sativum]
MDKGNGNGFDLGKRSHGQDSNWQQAATGATFFSGEPAGSGQFCRFLNLHGNARSLYQNEAGVMYITPVTLNHTPDSYKLRNLRWKIQGQNWGLTVWHSLTNVNATSWDALNATYIHNPAIRYFYRVLGHTVFGRVNNHKVNSKELLFLHCVFTPVAFNATPFLLANIQAACVRGNTVFYFGGNITSIALGLNLGDRLANLPALSAEFLNIDYCRSSHLIKVRDDERYHLVVRNKIV